MTLINLDSIQFYQPPTKADLAGKGPSMSSVGDIPVICGEGPTVPIPNGGVGSFNDYDLIEVVDSTGSSSKDPLNLLLYKHVLNLKDTELYTGGSICCLRFL